MKILFIGDIVGEPGRKAIKILLPKLIKEKQLDFVIANAENAAGGSGITPMLANELFSFGVDCITTGDHIWKRKEIVDAIDEEPRILRPANYPKGAPGLGSNVIVSKSGVNVAVIDLMGRVFMNTLDCPFESAKREIQRLKGRTNIIIVDMHAEATSEKIAMGWFLDGQVSAICGTHTHIQTADERILPNGTAYITDVGMTGPYDSVIGRKKEEILRRFLTQMPTRFEVAENDIKLCAAIIEVDFQTGKAKNIERVQAPLETNPNA